MHQRLLLALMLGVIAVMVSGCSGTQIIEDSPVMQLNPEQPYSTVYILREHPKYRTGFPEQPIKIDINGHDVGSLSYGEYIMLKIKPTEGTIRFTSLDIYGPVPDPRELSGEETFNLAAGQTNFIRVKFIDGEFRGAYFVPERIEFNTAREISKRLRPYDVESGHLISDL